MFQNPSTLWLEILVLAAVIVFFGALIAVRAYRKAHHLPTGECAHCHHGKSTLLSDYRKSQLGKR